MCSGLGLSPPPKFKTGGAQLPSNLNDAVLLLIYAMCNFLWCLSHSKRLFLCLTLLWVEHVFLFVLADVLATYCCYGNFLKFDLLFYNFWNVSYFHWPKTHLRNIIIFYTSIGQLNAAVSVISEFFNFITFFFSLLIVRYFAYLILFSISNNHLIIVHLALLKLLLKNVE